MFSVVAGGFFLSNNTSEFLNATVQTTLDGSVPLSEVFFPSVVVCNINQIRKSFFEELGFYENDTLVRIMYEDFIKGTIETETPQTKPIKTGLNRIKQRQVHNQQFRLSPLEIVKEVTEVKSNIDTYLSVSQY